MPHFWTLWNFLTQPFVLGLLIGLALTAVVWKDGFSRRRQLARDLQRTETEKAELQNHLLTHLKLHADGNAKLTAELDDLRSRNETLRINLATLQQKPGQAELRQLRIQDAAIRQMREQAPGFAPAWEKALRQAETDANAAESGLMKLVRRVQSGIGMGNPPAATTAPTDPSDTPA